MSQAESCVTVAMEQKLAGTQTKLSRYRRPLWLTGPLRQWFQRTRQRPLGVLAPGVWQFDVRWAGSRVSLLGLALLGSAHPKLRWPNGGRICPTCELAHTSPANLPAVS